MNVDENFIITVANPSDAQTQAQDEERWTAHRNCKTFHVRRKPTAAFEYRATNIGKPPKTSIEQHTK